METCETHTRLPLAALDAEPALPNSRCKTATEIAEALLEKTGHAVMTGDFETFRACFILPNEVHTLDGHQVVNDAAKLREIFDGMREHLRMQNVTHMIRRIYRAQFEDPDTISSAHTTRLVSGTMYVQEPYSVASKLRRTDGVWQVAYSKYSVVDQPLLIKALSG